MHFPLLPLLLAVPLVAGIEFTSPAGGDSFVQGGEVTVEWTSVDTDPTIFSLYLWNFANFPPFYEPLVFDIDTVDGLTTVTLPCDVVASGGYQFSAINGTNVYVIYAQTGIFTITEGSCVAPTGTTSSPGVVTVTVTAELTCTSNGTIVTTAKPSYPSSSVLPFQPTSTFSLVIVNAGASTRVSWAALLLGVMIAAVAA